MVFLQINNIAFTSQALDKNGETQHMDLDISKALIEFGMLAFFTSYGVYWGEMCKFSQEQAIEKLKKAFKVGLQENQSFKYLGLEVYNFRRVTKKIYTLQQ